MPVIKIPIYFSFDGFDHNDPAELTEQYFQHLNAPMENHLVSFKNSSFDLFADDPQKLVLQTLSIRKNKQ
jgi:hypothetical protein